MPENLIHLTDRTGPITATIKTDAPLPVAAYEVIARLAEAVADAEVALAEVLDDAEPEDEPIAPNPLGDALRRLFAPPFVVVAPARYAYEISYLDFRTGVSHLPTVVKGDPADRSTWVTMRAGTHGTVVIPTAEPIRMLQEDS